MIYGTAWKEEATTQCVLDAVAAGFRAIDTANQKKHYREDYVGDALLKLWKEGFKREDFYLQSKFTYKEGQDHRLPYDPTADYRTQVRSSFESSLQHLHTDYLDSYLLHGPQEAKGLTDADWEVWAAMEELLKEGKTRSIGVSNVAGDQIREFVEKADIKPQTVQNRCYAVRDWDGPVREYSLSEGIAYQGFFPLTANPQIVSHPKVLKIAERYSVTAPQVVFAYAIQIGILPLIGTTDPTHMREDMAVKELSLTTQEIELIGSL